MPVIYTNIAKQEALGKEPYKSLTKQFKWIKNDFNNQEIEIRIASDKEGFLKGFYTDHTYTNNPAIHFVFYRSNSEKSNDTSTFVRLEYSFECNDINYHYYLHHIRLLKKRIPYFYIPFASNFEFSHCIDDRIKMIFDVLVPDEDKVLETCYCLLNLVIAIHSFED